MFYSNTEIGITGNYILRYHYFISIGRFWKHTLGFLNFFCSVCRWWILWWQTLYLFLLNLKLGNLGLICMTVYFFSVCISRNFLYKKSLDRFYFLFYSLIVEYRIVLFIVFNDVWGTCFNFFYLLQVGERIRVILDCEDNTLSFEKNYEFLGVAFRGKC